MRKTRRGAAAQAGGLQSLADMRFEFSEVSGVVTFDTALGSSQSANLTTGMTLADIGGGQRGIVAPSVLGMLVSDTLIYCPTNAPWSIETHWLFNSYAANPFALVCKLKSGVVNNPFNIFLSNSVGYQGINIGSANLTRLRTNFSVSQALALLGVWQHVVVTFDGVSVYKIYLNAVNQALIAPAAYSLQTDQTEIVGAAAGTVTRWDGKQNFIRHYAFELDQSQVTELNSQKGAPT